MTTSELIAALQRIVQEMPEAADMTVRLQVLDEYCESYDSTEIAPEVWEGEVCL